MKDTYKPIDCGFHDHLEAAASTRERVTLEYLNSSGEPQTSIATIDDIESSGGEEFLRLSSGETIRLDRVVKLNEITFPGHK